MRFSQIVRAARLPTRIAGVAFASLIASLTAIGAEDRPAPPAVHPKQAARVAIVFNGTAEHHGGSLDAFLRGLHSHGYTNGHSVALDVRWMESRLDALPDAIAKLLARKPDVLVVAGSQAAQIVN